ncbi:major paralogous domain-containing protein [Fibrobacter sp. UWOV1]|uniref:fibrobacter succinogenes major paralogous domain-containing protein n=1 Tax=Fibrobacter sp. UWOV1 TaxID=1896215 RepID=UPI000918BA15|nr:fibrobacter succinogenes major paralogous domain-containing protein [Fibrobacter sp. UWOV1]SHK39733.1 major paralogous domain-containing protein [Fibrobacter sp. UWOV1]
MKKSFQRVIATLNLFQGKQSLTIFLFAAFFALSACDDSSSASDDGGETSTKSSNSNSSGNGAKSSNSSAGKVDCSALLEGNTGWSWDVPKECRFNPDIDYGSMTDERDGNVYRTVKIGDQVWMAENLNYDPGQGGLGEDKYDWSWCYDDKAKNCEVAGRLYTWAAAIDSVKLANDIEKPCVCGFYKECTNIEPVQGICPKGWHLPSRSEWDTLFIVVYGASTAGYELKALSGWNGKGNGDDSFGFTAIPSGIRTFSQRFDQVGHYAYFWSSTDAGGAYYGNSAFGIYLIDYDRSRYEKRFGKDGGYSIRCLKDSE